MYEMYIVRWFMCIRVYMYMTDQIMWCQKLNVQHTLYGCFWLVGRHRQGIAQTAYVCGTCIKLQQFYACIYTCMWYVYQAYMYMYLDEFINDLLPAY